MKWPTFDAEDQVPETFRELYEERDGTWQIKKSALENGGSGGGGKGSDDRLDALAASVERLEGALESERDLRKEAERKAREAEEQLTDLKGKGSGLEPEEMEQLREDIRTQEIQKLENIETLPADHPTRKKVEELRSENRSLKLDQKVKALAGKNGVPADKLDPWWKLHGEKFDLTDDGKPMVAGRPGLEVDQFITSDLKEETPYLYDGTKAAGGGGGGDHTKPGDLKAGTDADDVLKNPGAALTAAREGAGS